MYSFHFVLDIKDSDIFSWQHKVYTMQDAGYVSYIYQLGKPPKKCVQGLRDEGLTILRMAFHL